MLTKLHIKNYAIIDEIEIDFSDKLNIITGETGAGKSILMGALSLILGERADSSSLVSKDKKCFIEGTFSIANNKAVTAYLQSLEEDMDTDHSELVLRREIAPTGKSRAFINDTPASLQTLRGVASLLVDLHQQFDTLELGNTDFQRTVIDALAGNENLLQSFTNSYQAYLSAQKKLAALLAQKEAFTKEADYNQFLLDEFEELQLQTNELELMEQELVLLNNAEGIKTALAGTSHALAYAETPVVSVVKQMLQQLQPFTNVHEGVSELINRLQVTHIELQDIASELSRLENTISTNEERLHTINERMAAGFKLLKKHGVTTTQELLDIWASLSEKLLAVQNIDDAIAAHAKQEKETLAAATEIATKISAARKSQSAPLQKSVNTLLAQVGMPNASIQVSITNTNLNAFGTDQIEFLFDANKSGKYESIKKVASGGELSRLMLCIKSLVATSVNLPTLIFDEIDTGISGEAAKQVGIIMQGLAASRQIICITHQPQIAGKANAHFFVYKQSKESGIATHIKRLTKEERINAIAQMLSGEQPTPAAIATATEMVEE
jgi:DNA repair protein RecN (Recombination protein N)